MKYENKVLIIWIIFVILCLSVSLISLQEENYKNTNQIIELNNQKEVLEIENLQLKNILEGY